jgi:hypothetical protein
MPTPSRMTVAAAPTRSASLGSITVDIRP